MLKHSFFLPISKNTTLKLCSYKKQTCINNVDIKQDKFSPITATVINCERGTIFDLMQNRCNKFTCTADYQETDYKCVR